MARLKIDSEKGSIVTEGSVREVAALLMVAINQIYSTLAGTEKLSAEAFRMAVLVGVSGSDSPIWKVRTDVETTSIVMPVFKKGGAGNGTTDI